MLTLTVGTGKTFLSSKVVERVQDEASKSPDLPGFAYFYCNELRAMNRKSGVPLLRSLIRQLTTTSRKAREISMSLGYTDEDNLGDAQPTVEMCQEALLTALTLHPKTFLVLDGLEVLQPDALQSCVDTLASLLESSARPLKIFVSSRYNPAMWQLMQSSTELTFHSTLPHWDPDDMGELLVAEKSYSDTYFDIERFVRANSNNIPQQLVTRFVRGSEGV